MTETEFPTLHASPSRSFWEVVRNGIVWGIPIVGLLVLGARFQFGWLSDVPVPLLILQVIIGGAALAFFISFCRENPEAFILDQQEHRGEVPDKEWASHSFDPALREELRRILQDNIFGSIDIHPDDSLSLLLLYNYDSMGNLEVFIEIDDHFGVDTEKIQEDLFDEASMTVLEFLQWIEQHRTRFPESSQ